jgi:recombinational DNA repair protein RecT
MALAKACQLNLVAGGVLHRAHMVPIWNSKKKTHDAELWIDYTGLMELVRRSGEVANFVARVVHEGEDFEHYFDLDDGEVLRHKPSYNGDVGAPKLAYAVCFFKDGQRQVEVMRKDQIEKIRDGSRSGGNGPWKTHTEEMWRKTVIRRICKYLPLTAEARTVLAHDTSADITGQAQEFFIPKPVLDDLEKEASTGRMVNMEAIDVDAEIVDTNKKNKRRKTNSKAAEVLSQSDFSSAEDDFVLE